MNPPESWMRFVGRRSMSLCAGAVLVIGFFSDWARWFDYGKSSSLYSYTLLVPWLAAALMLPRIYRGWMMLPAIIMLAALWFMDARDDVTAPRYGALFVFCSLMALVIVAAQGRAWTRENIMPLLLLYLAIPLPPAFEMAFNQWLQDGSAWTSYVLFQWLQFPVYREGHLLLLPDLALHVDPSCSGIRSTLVLLIAALVLGHCLPLSLPLKSVLVAAAVPIGIVRNTIRIATLAVMTLHVDPDIIRGPLHRQGGPLFFIISLGILLALARGLVAIQRAGRKGIVT